MGSVHARGDTFLTFGLKALTETNTSRLATAMQGNCLIYVTCERDFFLLYEQSLQTCFSIYGMKPNITWLSTVPTIVIISRFIIDMRKL
jgi:hypothetical protein